MEFFLLKERELPNTHTILAFFNKINKEDSFFGIKTKEECGAYTELRTRIPDPQ